MERQPGIVPNEADRQAMSPNDQCSFHLDERALQHNPTWAKETAKSVIFPFMMVITHTDLI